MFLLGAVFFLFVLVLDAAVFAFIVVANPDGITCAGELGLFDIACASENIKPRNDLDILQLDNVLSSNDYNNYSARSVLMKIVH